MKKNYLFLVTGLLFSTASFSQVTVTNPTNTTPNLAATYTSLANAITALDGITAISGPVTISLTAGNPQTAPAGGYVIQFAATTTAANNITITGNNNTITAFTPQASGNINDAIFKLIGVDYVSISNFTMQENPANTTTAVATNNMTEWGVALLRASATDGAQNNTIQNNTISLDRSYSNTFGIYSSSIHTAIAADVYSDIINNTTAPNNANKIYGNSISNVNMGITLIGSRIAANMDIGNDIGGNAVVTGNTITNWGGAAAASLYVSNSVTSYCIFMNHQVTDNVSYNSITSATLSGTAISFSGIRKEFTSTAPTGTFTSSITNNTITMSSGFTSGLFRPIYCNGITAASTATLNINSNNILNCVMSGASSSSDFTAIYNQSVPSILNITFNIIRGYTSTATTGGFTGIENAGAVVNAINITNNKIGDAISGAMTFSVANTAIIYMIKNTGAAATATINLNNNSVDGISCVNTGAIYVIRNLAPSGVAINMNNNQLGSVTGTLISYSGLQTGGFTGILSDNGTGAAILTIQNNDIKGIQQPVAGSGFYSFIVSGVAVLSQNVLSNTFTNLSVKTSGPIFLISRGGTMVSGASWTCTNNSIVTGFSSTSASQVTFISSNAGSVNGSTMTETGNNFSNVTVTGGTLIYGIRNLEGVSSSSGPSKTISGNSFNNIIGGSQQVYVIYVNNSSGANCSNNIISNISASSTVTCLYFGVGNGQGTLTCSSNTISNIAGTDVTGIDQSASMFPTANINNNNISGLSCTAVRATGIQAVAGGTVNIYDNLVHNISSASSGAILIGIFTGGATTVNEYRNKIYDITASGPVGGVAVYGMLFSNGSTTSNAYNNFISDLKAPNANASSFATIQGIGVLNITAPSVTNLYYNSIYINGVSTGTDFSTAGIYHTTNATATTGALNMMNNIIVNTSTPNGTGVTAAYCRSSTTLNNYAATSDYNLFYAGPPAANKLIFYDGTNSDQTLASFQTRVSPREANSISAMPAFTSITDLHLTTANCQLDGRGTPISITTDIDGTTRDAVTPDIGADEFTATASTNLAGVVGSAICETRTVSGSGTTYTSNACDLIAKVLPAGGLPVSGLINACVTLDATQQFFNGEPYVQRHYDI